MKAHLLAAAASLALARLALGCALPDSSATFTATCPDRASFTVVSTFIEPGCGLVDCHGAPSRALKIMGYDGLRLSPTDRPGGNPTTVAEVDANWRSVCGLQPELITQVVEGLAPPTDLLLLQKPLMLTHHKGNQVIVMGDDGYTCLTSWLTGNVDAGACTRAAAAQQQQ